MNDKKVLSKRMALSENLSTLRKALGLEIPNNSIFLLDENKLDIKDEMEISLEDVVKNGNNVYLCTPKYEMKEKSKIEAEEYKKSKSKKISAETEKIPAKNDETTQEKGREELPLPKSITLSDEKGLKIYQYPCVDMNKYDSALAHIILVVGETGTGKTTLLNSLINYLLKVEITDSFRYKVINEVTNKSQAHSQTSEVTVYNIASHNGFPALQIVDTPGFGDTRGIEQDKKITDLIKQTFKTRLDSLTSICFVARSSNPRLSFSQKYIFSKILELFGKDVGENFVCLLTFCDGNDPPILDALQEDASIFSQIIKKIKDPWYLKFNNSAIFNNSTDKFACMFWEIGMNSFDILMSKLKSLHKTSLTLSKEVLETRRKLENTITTLQPMLDQGLSKMSQIERLMRQLENKAAEINGNKDFVVPTSVDKMKKIPITDGTYTTTCLPCNFTCHRSCAYANDSDKNKCCAITNNYCTVCPKKCHHETHKNLPYLIEWYSVTEFVTNKDLEKRYYSAKNEASKSEQILNGLDQELLLITNKCIEIQEDIKNSIDKLKSIALHDNVYESSEQYIDLLIKSEQDEKKLGHEDRIQSLKVLKKQHQEIMNAYKNQSKVKDLQEFRNMELQKRNKKLKIIEKDGCVIF